VVLPRTVTLVHGDERFAWDDRAMGNPYLRSNQRSPAGAGVNLKVVEDGLKISGCTDGGVPIV
jgi:hypothetical protein